MATNPFWADKNAGVIDAPAPEARKAPPPPPRKPPMAPPAEVPQGGGGDEAPDIKEIWHALEDLNKRVAALEGEDAGEAEAAAPLPFGGG